MKLTLSYAKIQTLVSAYLAEHVNVKSISSSSENALTILLEIQKPLIKYFTTTCKVELIANNTETLQVKFLEYPLVPKIFMKLIGKLIDFNKPLPEGVHFEREIDLLHINSHTLLENKLRLRFTQAQTANDQLSLECTI